MYIHIEKLPLNREKGQDRGGLCVTVSWLGKANQMGRLWSS